MTTMLHLWVFWILMSAPYTDPTGFRMTPGWSSQMVFESVAECVDATRHYYGPGVPACLPAGILMRPLSVFAEGKSVPAPTKTITPYAEFDLAPGWCSETDESQPPRRADSEE